MQRLLGDTLCVPRTKNLIDGSLISLSGNSELLDDEISPTALPGRPMSIKGKNKISDIVLNDTKKDLIRHVKSKVESLKALIDDTSLL